MSKLNLKRAPRISVPVSTGDTIELRALNPLDISELAKQFDGETLLLTERVMAHIRAGGPLDQIFTDPTFYVDLMHCVPDLMLNAIVMSAGGDAEDREALRELDAQDLTILVARLLSYSLERIGGLGKLLEALAGLMSKTTDLFEAELRKKQGQIS